MKRIALRQPGYDCIYAPCEFPNPCRGGRRGHGICGERWAYGVKDGDVALVLRVTTNVFPSTVPADHAQRCGLPPDPPGVKAEGRDFEIHRVAPNAVKQDCEIFPGGCNGESDVKGALFPDRFFKEHGRNCFDQWEPFWKAMEDLMPVVLAEVAERAEAEAWANPETRLRRRIERELAKVLSVDWGDRGLTPTYARASITAYERVLAFLDNKCEMIVGHKVDADGDPGDEIYCTNTAEFVHAGTVLCCAACAAKMRAEGFEVVRG